MNMKTTTAIGLRTAALRKSGKAQDAPKQLDAIDHIALQVQDVAEGVRWYTGKFACNVMYQDETWAFLEFENTRLALVVPAQHPAHLGLISSAAEDFGPLLEHRDGTRSTYIQDPSGNSVEILAPYRPAAS